MNIERNKEQPLINIQLELKKMIEQMANQAASSVVGARPDEEGRYSKQRINDKERREILNIIIGHDDLLNLNEKDLALRFASADDFLKEFTTRIQNYPENVCIPICKMVEKMFDFKVEYLDRNEVRFQNQVNVAEQMLDLSEKEIREQLGYGKLGDEKEKKIILDKLLPKHRKKKL